MTQSLEAQLTALCEQHGLNHISLETHGDGLFYACAHRGGIARHSMRHKPDAADAIASAIEELNAACVPTLGVEPLAPMADAA